MKRWGLPLLLFASVLVGFHANARADKMMYLYDPQVSSMVDMDAYLADGTVLQPDGQGFPKYVDRGPAPPEYPTIAISEPGIEMLGPSPTRIDGVIGVMNGTSEQEVADQIFDAERVNVQGNLSSLILELKSGRCDAIGLTSANLRLAAESDPEVEVTEGFWLVDPKTGEDMIGAGAAVFQPADTDFRDAVNGELEKLLADTATWEGLTAEYGFTVAENHPEGLTAEDLCPDTYQ